MKSIKAYIRRTWNTVKRCIEGEEYFEDGMRLRLDPFTHARLIQEIRFTATLEERAISNEKVKRGMAIYVDASNAGGYEGKGITLSTDFSGEILLLEARNSAGHDEFMYTISGLQTLLPSAFISVPYKCEESIVLKQISHSAFRNIPKQRLDSLLQKYTPSHSYEMTPQQIEEINKLVYGII